MKLFGLIAIIIGSLVFWHLSPESPPKSAKTAEKVHLTKKKPPDGRIKRSPLACRPNVTTVFNLNYENRGELRDFKLATQSTPVDAQTGLSFAGQMKIYCLAEADDVQQWLIVMTLDDFHEEATGPFNYERAKLEQPFKLHWHARRGAEQIAVSPELDRANTFVLVDIANHLSIAWLQSPSQPFQWTAKQELNAGPRQFTYQLRTGKQGIELTKKFTRKGETYLAQYQLNAGRLRTFTMSYEQQKKLSTGASLTNRAKLDLEHREIRKEKLTASQLLPAQALGDIGDTTAKIYASELGDLTAQDLLAELNQLDRKEKVTEYYKKFKALFYLHKNAVDLFLEPLRTLPADSEKYQVLILAMIKAGHPEIQNFLTEKILLAKNTPPEKIITTLGLMSMLSTPATKTIRQVVTIAETHHNADVRSNSWLSASAMARKVTGDQASIQGELMRKLKHKSLKDQNASDKLETIHAAGNLGHQSLIDLVKSALQAPDLTTKQAALLSLRFMDAELVQALLIEHMSDAKDESLAMTAFEVTSYQELTAEMLKHLLKISESAKKEQLRLAALQLLKQKIDTAPSLIRKALDQASRYDPSLQVRQYADSLVLSL